MSAYEPYSTRTKRRKIASAVNEAMLLVDCVGDHIACSGSSTDSYLSNHFKVLSEISDCSTVECDKPASIVSSDSDSHESANEGDSAVHESSWDDCAFERDFELYGSHYNDNCNNDPDPDSNNIRANLCEWAVRHKITHSALYDLLQILQKQNKDLPIDPRTLLATPKDALVVNITGGSFYYFGVQNALYNLVNSVPDSSDLIDINELTLHVNVDGIPLFNSAKTTLWPILGLCREISSSPFPIALFCGVTKPLSLDEFLQDFVEEMKKGCVRIHDRDIPVRIDAVICDAPARAMLKCCKGHTAYNCCERCVQKGLWRNKITFGVETARLRTDDGFKQQRDSNHHVSVSPLAVLPIGLVSQFPLDYMHVVCLGVVRRIIMLWSSGPPFVRLSSTLLQAISDRLVAYRSFMPRLFARKPRSLAEAKMWKATEYRTFLLYTGPVALKGLLRKKLYQNFLCLSVAISICLNPKICLDYADYCEKLLKYFVKTFSKLYGENQVVYNVHCLTHLVDDVRRFGCLDNVSAFPYENYLGYLKGIVRNANNPVRQIVNRLAEADSMTSGVKRIVRSVYKKRHCDGPIPCNMAAMNQYKQFENEHVFLSCEYGENCVEICGQIGIIRNILHKEGDSDNSCFVLFSPFVKMESLYSSPVLSQNLGVHVLSKLSESCTLYSLKYISSKCLMLPMPNETGFASFPLQSL
jgi:hypothetical protein